MVASERAVTYRRYSPDSVADEDAAAEYLVGRLRYALGLTRAATEPIM